MSPVLQPKRQIEGVECRFDLTVLVIAQGSEPPPSVPPAVVTGCCDRSARLNHCLKWRAAHGICYVRCYQFLTGANFQKGNGIAQTGPRLYARSCRSAVANLLRCISAAQCFVRGIVVALRSDPNTPATGFRSRFGIAPGFRTGGRRAQ